MRHRCIVLAARRTQKLTCVLIFSHKSLLVSVEVYVHVVATVREATNAAAGGGGANQVSKLVEVSVRCNAPSTARKETQFGEHSG
jgi:hypothetical protein